MGPEATTALMTLVAIKPLAAGDPARYAELASTLALLTGVMAVAAWLLRLGFVANLLSRPVLVGYMAGVALIMIADQLKHVTGIPVTGQAFFAQVGSFARGLGHLQPTVLAVSVSVLGFLLLLRWRWPRMPGPLLAVLLATVAVAAFRPGGVGVVGPVPAARAAHGAAARPSSAIAARAAAARVHRADRGLQRRRGNRPFVRAPRRGDRGKPGAAGARRGQRRLGAGARLPGQQQRDQDGHRGHRRQQDQGVLAGRGGRRAGGPAVRALPPVSHPDGGARRDRDLRRDPADRRDRIPAQQQAFRRTELADRR